MTLRVRLFLLLGGLVALLVVGQNLLVRSLAARLDRDVVRVATRVGQEIVSGFELRTGDEGPPPGAEPRSPPPGKRIVVITREVERVERPAEGDASGSPQATAAEAETRTWQWNYRQTVDLDGADPAHVDEALQAFERLQIEPLEHDRTLLLRGPSLARAIPVPGAQVTSTLDRFRSQLAAGSLALLALGLVAAAALAEHAARPLAQLANAARRVGAGELGVVVPQQRSDEIGAAIGAFNAMSVRLAELDRENRRLIEAEQLSELGEVARGLAHTLRNPLNALGLSVEQIAAESDPERAATLAEASRRQIRRMDAALRSFLALSSSGAAAQEQVDLAATAREVALEALQDASRRVRIEVDAPQPVPIAGVPAELQAIVQALIVNACEASPEGETVRVELRSLPGAGRSGARLAVEDRGAGLAPAVRARLFAPHVTTKPHGSGMGLFLAQRLASGRYGGEIRFVDPTPGATDRAGTRVEADLFDRDAGPAPSEGNA